MSEQTDQERIFRERVSLEDERDWWEIDYSTMPENGLPIPLLLFKDEMALYLIPTVFDDGIVVECYQFLNEELQGVTTAEVRRPT